ncbi:hypothetical protein E1286_20300 [Nonomuraea terrae]|uniref:Uncharacterized protein n=1 Tax=Nonomuraea terrae TaxID=2530383 RepID=A0A4R4YQI7_9ACTN|nr:hypothetical protein [Nonomuraea terrae]TDD46574.1 hypothetical protein E1286_20300 [Nonomuraea terrae]
MKRPITILAAGSAVLAAAVPTQAASKEPVRALEAKLAPGHGVRFTETTTFGDGTEERPVHASDLGGGTEVSYTLTLTSANLVSRVESTYRLPDHHVVYEDDQGMTVHADTRYSGWGDKVSIKAPDPDTVGDKIEGLPRLPGSYKLRSCKAT